MNSGTVTHPLNRFLGYRDNFVHSELDAYLKIRWRDVNYKKCTLVNTRINSFSKFGMSKPCKSCRKLIKKLGINKVYYTDKDGKWQKM